MTLKEKVYMLVSTVPEGKVTTYKYLAHNAGTKSYRAVGQILRVNPYAPIIPCHRVVSSDGTIGGFMGSRKGPQVRKKIKLLRSEGIQIKDGRLVDFQTIVVSDFPLLPES
jgi:methylated-DNA-[protein]-cysteine S-methyltransferase